MANDYGITTVYKGRVVVMTSTINAGTVIDISRTTSTTTTTTTTT